MAMPLIIKELPSIANHHSLEFLNKLTEDGLKDRILKYGVFGSSIYSDKPNDIDILLIIKNISSDYSSDADLIKDVEKRMRGNYSSNTMVEDHRINGVFCRSISEYSESNNIQIESGIGPSSTVEKNRCWIHLNGPMFESTWNLFAKRFPIHATSISYNYFSIIGGEINAYKYDDNDIILYIKDMKTRFIKYKLTPSYTKKIIKATAMLLGEKSCDLDRCIKFILSKNIIDSKILKNDFLNNFELQNSIVNSLIKHIEIKYKDKIYD